MPDCPKCGKGNVDEAAFCTRCGTVLKSSISSSIERQTQMFAHDMEQIGKNLGESMTQMAQRIKDNSHDFGKRIEQRIDLTTKHMGGWYERTFGIFGPMIQSFLFLIILRFAIVLIRISNDEIQEINTTSSVILLYLLPMFGVILVGNYTTYFTKKSYKFRIFSPLFHSITFVLILWIIAQILRTLQDRLSIEALGTAALNIENVLPTIFILILLIGYVFLALNMSREQERNP